MSHDPLDLSDLEALSRLVDGDCDAGEAATLRARMATEPALAQAWAVVSGLADDLGDLAESPAPPAVDAAVTAAFAGGVPAPPSLSRWPRWVGVGVAAGLLLAVGAAVRQADGPEPAAVLVEGTEYIRGDTTVLAAGVVVDVHGRARVDVEPPPGVVREDLQDLLTGDPMNRTPILAALGGALVTVTVYEGTALIRGDGAQPDVTVDAGVSHSQAVPGGASAPVSAIPRRTTMVVDAPSNGSGPDGSPTYEELADRVAELELQSALAKGQLAAAGLEPLPWPEGMDASLQPGSFERAARELAQSRPDLSLAELDCSEYPCLAVYAFDGAPDAFRDAVDATSDALQSSMGAPEDANASVWASNSVSKDPETGEEISTQLMGVAITDGDSEPVGRDPRVNGRMQDLLAMNEQE